MTGAAFQALSSSTVPSVEPPSATMSSTSGWSWRAMLARQRSSIARALRQATMRERRMAAIYFIFARHHIEIPGKDASGRGWRNDAVGRPPGLSEAPGDLGALSAVAALAAGRL